MTRYLVSAATLALCATASAQHYPYTVVDLEPGASTLIPSKPYGISDDGKTIACTRGSAGFVWREGFGFTPMSSLPGHTATSARAIDAAGNACGDSSDASSSLAVRYDVGGIAQSLGTLGGLSSVGYEMNASGTIVGDAMDGSGAWRAFAWTSTGGMVDLAPLAAVAHARDVTDLGTITGFTGPGGALTVDRAFRWSPTSGFVDLGIPGGFKNSRGLGINSAGQVCAFSQNSTGTVGAWVRYTDGAGWQYLLTNAGKANTPWKLNDFAQVVGETHQDSGALHRAAIYTDGIGIQDLNQLVDPAEGWLLRAAFDINERGQIVGWGEHGGSWHGFRLDPKYFDGYGSNCAGGGGHRPSLGGFGAPDAGSTVALMVAEGTPGGAGLLFVSAGKGATPVAGCTYLLGAPLGLPISFFFDANRQARFVGPMPGPVPSGVSVYFQVASLDPAAPNHSFALSNGLEMILP